MKRILLCLLCFMSLTAYAQHTVVVNPDGTHSVVIQTGNMITVVNPNGTHSTAIQTGNFITVVNPDGTHSTAMLTGNNTTMVSPVDTHTPVIKNGDDNTIANPKENNVRQALESISKKSDFANVARDTSAIVFVIDGIVWVSPDFTYEKLGPLDVEAVLDCFVEAVPFISKEDIDDFTIIKFNEWADKYHIYAQVPKDTIFITTKKESQIKTFVLNGKPTKRRRGIELGVLLDEELLKKQIQKKWRIKADKITGITIEDKTVSITTK